MSVNFMPGHFDGPSFSCLSFSAPPHVVSMLHNARLNTASVLACLAVASPESAASVAFVACFLTFAAYVACVALDGNQA